jgi:hypothetical protein
MRISIAAAATVLLLAGCSSTSDPFTPEGVAGDYTLTSVNGLSLPAEVSITEEGWTFTMTFFEGNLTVNADGTYSLSLTQEYPGENAPVEEIYTETGTYTLSDPSTITVTSSEDPETFSGTLVGNVLTVNVDGIVFVFTK